MSITASDFTTTLKGGGVAPLGAATTAPALVSTTASTTTAVGYSTTTQADAIVTAVNSIITVLKANGIYA